jgi:hypothetical protein
MGVGLGGGLCVGRGAGLGMEGDAWLGVFMTACLAPPQWQNQLPKINCQ